MLTGFAAWSIYGLFSGALTHYLSPPSHPLSWGRSLFYECSFAYIAALLSIGVIILAERFRPEGPRRLRNIFIHVGGAVAFATIARLIWEAVANYHQMPVLNSILWGMADAVPLYALIVFVHYAGDYYRRYKAGLVQAADLNAQLARAQLQSLKMQLHPHFLFNTLHAISELIHEDPVAAERMILGLSQLLRVSLETSSAVEVPLDLELQFTQLYLDIEKMRFDERLVIEIEIDPEAREALVPNLILQPLLENAIKHGISKRPGLGRIHLSAKRDGGLLVIVIRDNGAGIDLENGPLREGIGLGTTRERLAKLYGANQSFHFVRRPGAGAEAVIRMPFQLENKELIYATAARSDR